MHPEPTVPRNSSQNRAVLVSIGGASAPILHVLRQHQPEHVWYFCSAGSRAVADVQG